MEKEFFEFLAENGVLFQFIQGLSYYKKFTSISDLCKKITYPEDYIMCAFAWSNNCSNVSSEDWG